MTFGENLKRICNERGTTPTTIMKKWGLSTSKVSAWYEGSLPKQEMLVRLAKELDCSVMDFFADEEDLVKTVQPTDEDEEDILRIYRSLSRRNKHEFMSMVYEFEGRIELDGDKEEVIG
jgi:transcriptional regulator with XRE-family HTH domain